MKKYQLYDFFELLIGAFAIFASGITIFTFFKHKLAPEITISFSIIIAIALVIFLKLCKIYSISNKRLRLFSEVFHSLTHFVRDEYYGLGKAFKRGKANKEVLNTQLKRVGERVVTLLSQVLTASTGHKTSVCIKYFCMEEPHRPIGPPEEKLEDLTVTVLCRCTNSNPKRRKETVDKIKDNTDLMKITIEDHPEFAVTDLKSFSKKLKEISGNPYRDSNYNWADFFNSKIVVPIRLKKDLTPDEEFGGEGFDLLGFISVDTESKSAFQEEDLPYYVDLVKSFADVLYEYLDRFYFLWYKYD